TFNAPSTPVTYTLSLHDALPILLEGRRPALVVGGSGGPTIISGTLQVMLGVLAFGLPLREAVVAPRVHDQATPPVLAVEAGVERSEEHTSELQSLRHLVCRLLLE